jgi:hypothetical protein
MVLIGYSFIFYSLILLYFYLKILILSYPIFLRIILIRSYPDFLLILAYPIARIRIGRDFASAGRRGIKNAKETKELYKKGMVRVEGRIKDWIIAI